MQKEKQHNRQKKISHTEMGVRGATVDHQTTLRLTRFGALAKDRMSLDIALAQVRCKVILFSTLDCSRRQRKLQPPE